MRSGGHRGGSILVNSKGLTAFLDAMIFLVLIMTAVSVTAVAFHIDTDDGPDPDDFLTDLSKMQLRLSDMTEIEDDSLSYISDLMAYSVSHKCDVQDYLVTVLDEIFGERRYCMAYTFQDETITLGDPDRYYRSISCRSMAISTGGSIYISLSVL